MRTASNTFIVKCKDCRAQWGKHWPCEGTEAEIRFGEHQCGACYSNQQERELEEEIKSISEDCGLATCPFNGQKHTHVTCYNAISQYYTP